MNILILMVPISLMLGFGFVVAFIWAAERDQFEDIETPAYRILDAEEQERMQR